MSILKPKAPTKTAAMSLRLPTELHQQLQALQADADRAGFVFDASDVCVKALAAAVKSARAELANAGAERAAHDRQQAAS
ncbi:conserved hypothetical protein [Thiomonas sp. X19]|uniref:hypothetical protein n=1 Tax=Thiomonas sp. X19 TaxID=1050370 RepID=UPI000B6C5EA8|nr:hypothetical protein [Thiomonas sp. X19]SCC95099.1 conserved hypothetical protein [Thiomonas sp. X19]